MCRFSRTLAVLAVFTAGLLASCSKEDRKGEQAPAAEAPPAETPRPTSAGAEEPPADEPATPVEPEAEPPKGEPQVEQPRGEAKPTEPTRGEETRAEPKGPREPREPRAEPKEPREPKEPADEPREPDQQPASRPGSAPDQGQPCDGGRCAKGLTCVEYYGIAGPRGPQMSSCEIRCPAGKGCPAGQHCETISDGPGPVCRPH